MKEIKMPEVEVPQDAMSFLELLKDGDPLAIVAMLFLVIALFVAVKITNMVLKLVMIGIVIMVVGVLFFPDLVTF